jgi:hypothetical protein
MQDVLQTQLREKAGSDSYNRYEYQMHWAMYHMMKKFQNGEEFIIFCEFHDDIAETPNHNSPKCIEFFQIKTKTKGNFTLNELLRKPPNKSHSFLGFIFYNFMKFNQSCTKCHFVGNKEFDIDIKKWQSTIQDNKQLEQEEPEIYNKIKQAIEKEYKAQGNLPNNFNDVFNVFTH